MEYERDYFVRGSYSPYQDFNSHDVRARKVIALTHPQSILDVGCAYGYMVRRFNDAGIPALGCDVSRWCGEQAAKIIPARYVLAPAGKLPFTDKAFDVIYCEGVLEHLDEGVIYDVAREFERVSNRRVLAVTFNRKETDGHLCNHDARWWIEWMPKNSYLFLGDASSDTNEDWMFKDAEGNCRLIEKEKIQP